MRLVILLIIIISLPIVSHAGTDKRLVLKMFYRSDCPPCRQEMRMLPEIARQNGNVKVEVISLDGAREAARPGFLPPHVRFVAGGSQEEHWLKEAGNRKLALPYSVMLDGRGGKCAEHYGMLGTQRVEEWAKGC